MSDELSLVVNGQQISGWTQTEVMLQCEGLPNSFEISLTSRDPASKGLVVARAGDPCEIYLGNDKVITGYVDKDSNAGGPDWHELKLIGRGKCADLVDCCAEWPSDQLINGDALSIATKLAQPYGIDVQLANGATAGPQVPAWALNYTERAEAIIQRVAQNAGLLAYEDHEGRLLLGSVGSEAAASGVVFGENVEEWAVSNAMDQRYSEIACAWLSTASLGDLGGGSDFFDVEPDPNVPRHRRLDIVLEDIATPEGAHDFTIRKAQWEVARRAGRATIATAKIDSWRDAAGALWSPNTLIPTSLPGLRVSDTALCLSSVKFTRDGAGTHAELTLLPKAAFLLAPISLLPTSTSDLKGPDAR